MDMDSTEIADNCRACQIRTHSESQIFMFATTNLPDIYQETTSLDIHENDGLPGVLCFSCYNRLLEAYNFRKMCSAAALHFQQILSMDFPEEKYIPPEYLSDPLMARKTDPDNLDPSNFLLEDKYSPPEEKFNRTEVPETIDVKPLMIGEENAAEYSNQISRKTKKTNRKRETSKGRSKKKTISLPGDTDQGEKRKRGYLECDFCNSKFIQKHRLEVHMLVKHQGVKAVKCKICGEGFTRPDSLKGHMGTVHGLKRKYPCSEPGCKKHYDTEEGLQNHMKSWHDPENPRIKITINKVCVCEICGKDFKTPGALKDHSYTHGVTKPHACTKCPKRFVSKTRLKIHTMRHEGIKNYECTFCGLKTVTARELKVHVNTHTKEKILSCDFCPYQNVNVGNLKKHVRVVHQGIRDFHCPHCTKSFGKAETLKHHVMTHTGEKPHACNDCGKRFIQKVALRTHMKTHLKSKGEARSEMDYVDITENCRACQIKTQEENTKIFIFTTMKLRDIFKETTSLDIHENDGLPKVLCCTCYDRLLEAYNFRKMCSAAVLYFEKILSMDMPEEKYTPPEHLSDPLMLTKPDPDYLDSSNYLPEDRYSPPEEKYKIPNEPVQMATDEKDEKPLEESTKTKADDCVLSNQKTSKAAKKREKSPRSSKKKIITLPENTVKQKKRKKLSLECNMCNLKFHRNDRLKVHMMVKHQGLKVCECKICGHGFTRADVLKLHMEKRHGAKRQFPCPEPGCKKHYDTEEGLQKHMKSWHDPENPRIPTNKVWVCEICGKECKSPYLLRKHSYSHGVTRPHACTKCPKRFSTRDNLTIHMMRHEGIKKYECTICGMKTVTSHELKIHVNTHTREKTLSCQFCDYQNLNLLNMKQHVKIVHQGARDFQCPHCDKSFGKANTLKYHVMTHTGEKPHACSECGKRFIQPTALKTHMKTHLKAK
ncbi:zinc finger protein 26-like [Phlebotomus papatasi]|uniref:zinc finger protein 26-like n=1 Tax=Phlebotomus papatasi TaxID=29031 RepID=UPI002483E730|nr:zinc finger protein 26-like [Phlebotomus papatasi]